MPHNVWMLSGFSQAFFFFLNDTATTEIYTLSLHDALPIYHLFPGGMTTDALGNQIPFSQAADQAALSRSEEHTSELQSRFDLVCRLLLEKKKKPQQYIHISIQFSRCLYIISKRESHHACIR